jgi:hypothetical protein
MQSGTTTCLDIVSLSLEGGNITEKKESGSQKKAAIRTLDEICEPALSILNVESENAYKYLALLMKEDTLRHHLTKGSINQAVVQLLSKLRGKNNENQAN